MEFYLLEELDFDLIVHHAYRSLTSIAENFGKGRGKGVRSSASASNLNSARNAIEPETPVKPGQSQSAGRGLNSLPPKPGSALPQSSHAGKASSPKTTESEGEDGALEEDGEIGKGMEDIRGGSTQGGDRAGDQTIDWEMNELDEQALQMAWFIINDTYRTEIPLIYPPYIIAISALLLALSLHPPARKKLEESWKGMEERRTDWKKQCEAAGFPVAVISNNANLHLHPPDPNEQKSRSDDLTLVGRDPMKGPPLDYIDLQAQRPLPPKNDILTFIASLNISLPVIAQVIQEIMDNYEVWHRVSNPRPSSQQNKSSTSSIAIDQRSPASTIPSINIPFHATPLPEPEAEVPDGAWGILQEGGNSANSNNSSASQTSSPSPHTQSSNHRSGESVSELTGGEIGILKRLEDLRERRRLKMIAEKEGSSKDNEGGKNGPESEAAGEAENLLLNAKKRKTMEESVSEQNGQGLNSKVKRRL